MSDDPDDVSARNESPPLSQPEPVIPRHESGASPPIQPPDDVTPEPSGPDVSTPGDAVAAPGVVTNLRQSAEPDDVDVTTPKEAAGHPDDVTDLRQRAGPDDVDVTTPQEVMEAGIAGALAPECSTQGSEFGLLLFSSVGGNLKR